MANFDDHDNELILTGFINDSIDSLPSPIPLLHRKFYAPLTAWVFAHDLDTL